MGNSLGGKRAAKVMKINGETMKLKTPVYAGEVVKHHPGHVLLDSEAVKHFGIRAKPLEPQQELKPKGLYFLVELPKLPEEKGPRRVQSGIQMSAKDRLESLMLARRSVSDLTIMKPYSSVVLDDHDHDHDGNSSRTSTSATTTTKNGGGNHVRVKMRLPKSQVEKMMMESKDGAEAASKIVDFCLANNKDIVGAAAGAGVRVVTNKKVYNNWNNEEGDILSPGLESREKRVGFLPFTEEEIQLAVA